ncbi:bifunctional UDP-N-acetylglucosamine diphosphorylase/glucosamine-1-phosphate N-acetyltransferase GlmU [Synechocystis sp. LKSZ1]|uniref:bifunctional UDP-N-acetylglucosamine diphosphorylase/glucosamine-1-phosphate N-acetyltransferase GlmU n=1 Tax=Synechocystis sp. LKSZ1 TaxID=3144951 RepID=UPI00336C180E
MVAVAILAAGKGTRMKSTLPKVLHRLGGLTLVERVLESCRSLNPERQLLIVGYQADAVRAQFQGRIDVEFVEQRQQLGTGHAIQQLLPHLQGYQGDLLVLNGDAPLLRPETLQQLMQTHQQHQNVATVLTAHLPNPKGYGRVFCDGNNHVTQIVEDRDCNDAQRKNHRINGGIYCFHWPRLAAILPQLQANNDQQEYYLTDVVQFLQPVMAMDVEDHLEISGINDRKQLASAYEVLQNRIKDQWMAAGVTLINPDSITIDDTVQIGTDVVIEPHSHLRGKTILGNGCRIGPGSLLEDSVVGEGTSILYSVVSQSTIASHCRIGPYSHLRGGAEISDHCRIGNFVEIKKSQIGPQTNVAHLSYLGDARLGERVNVGAGTITANYDGVNKHQTNIGNGTKTGANSVFVAPVTLGNSVTVAAGSVVTHDVPSDALVIARSRQRVIENWNIQPAPPASDS